LRQICGRTLDTENGEVMSKIQRLNYGSEFRDHLRGSEFTPEFSAIRAAGTPMEERTRTTFVAAHARGNADKGKIVKDYQLEVSSES
jgi:hypothetical protein